uniref:Putative ovule protein n=1 Tax=Solanum chacoense TaxID=4108 RepID=A0A0V0H0G5_SOLCH
MSSLGWLVDHYQFHSLHPSSSLAHSKLLILLSSRLTRHSHHESTWSLIFDPSVKPPHTLSGAIHFFWIHNKLFQGSYRGVV